ncbi:MAG TPA: VCBS repeat-containing protein [Gemmataceae bacterium]|nr:VCBS repeat-containing protein [Gemmataceae bacterium]
MRPHLLAAGLAVTLAVPAAAEPQITWKKTVLDTKFRSEGSAVADVNKDGKVDVLNGEYWYEAPDWKPHELQPPKDHGTGENGYSRSFACWADDFNADGYPDLIVIDHPGQPCYWMENPKGDAGQHWPKHVIWHSACNETPQYLDLFGTGKKVLLMAFQKKGTKMAGLDGQMAWFSPVKDPNALWEIHPISEPSVLPEVKNGKAVPGTGKVIPGTHHYAHGLGAGDINGDGRLDVIVTEGWWEQPAKDEGKLWTFHPARIGDAAADMYAHDMDGDGKADVLSSSAHKFGIWWHQQKPGKDNPAFVKHDLFKDLVSETHAMHFADIDGDGLKDLVTGKRFWSHGRAEPGANSPAMLYWFKATKGSDGVTSFKPMPIDDNSGVGTQFVVADINGDKLLDVVVSNKKGVCVIEQVRK